MIVTESNGSYSERRPFSKISFFLSVCTIKEGLTLENAIVDQFFVLMKKRVSELYKNPDSYQVLGRSVRSKFHSIVSKDLI